MSMLKNTYLCICVFQKDIRSDFEDYRPYLAADKAEILQTQGDFCRAVAEADCDLMRSIWHNSPDAMCFKVCSES
jgi:alpha-galactosidase/6-phospho-beta-glucosidase family protein